MLWLLEERTAAAMRLALDKGSAPSARDAAAYLEKEEERASASDRPRSFTQAGDVAEISVRGVLTPKPSLFALIFGEGNTTYPDIQAAIALAEAEPSVKRIQWNIHSPGGRVDGLFETLAAIQGIAKPQSVRASLAASAAYAIAASAGRITARNPASEFGSLGVAATLVHFPEYIDITSTNAPKKRPDPTTEEGKAVIREYLDQIHDLFVDAIAAGRGVSAATVNNEFGRGATMLAAQAKRAGMIDVVPRMPGRAARAQDHFEPEAEEEQPPQPKLVLVPGQNDAAKGAANEGKKPMSMDKDKLKAEHPEVYNAVFNEGAQAGVTKERDRVGAHLTMGQQSGDMKTAIDAIAKGEEMTQTLTAKYMGAAMNRRDQTDRQADSDKVENQVAGAGKKEGEGPDAQDAAIDGFIELRGYEVASA